MGPVGSSGWRLVTVLAGFDHQGEAKSVMYVSVHTSLRVRKNHRGSLKHPASTTSYLALKSTRNLLSFLASPSLAMNCCTAWLSKNALAADISQLSKSLRVSMAKLRTPISSKLEK